MRIGYPCVNTSLDCTANRTFRLRSYSPERLRETVAANLDCLGRILRYNVEHDLRHFRIGSGLVPFASHPVCEVDGAAEFADELRALGDFAQTHGLRLSMHPDQFTLLNSPDEKVLAASVRELAYHTRVLDAMGLGREGKIQIHVGGVYGDKPAALARFVERYERLDDAVRRRLAVENDDRLFTVDDCVELHERVGVPIVFDNLHHALNGGGEPVAEAQARAAATWTDADGPPMVDYSEQRPGGRRGAHADSIDDAVFVDYLEATQALDFDLMLEIKDKERSAVRGRALMQRHPRLAATGGTR